MYQLTEEVEARLSESRRSVMFRDLMRDFLIAAVTADPAVTVELGDPKWGAINILRSGQHIDIVHIVGRVFTKSGKIQIYNFVPDVKPDAYGDTACLGKREQWTFNLKSENDIDVILRCLADNIAHLGGRRIRPNATIIRPINSSMPLAVEKIRRTLSRAVRFAVLVRDDYTCQYCGRRAPEVVLHVDHRTPVSLGGRDELDNLLAACAECNLGKSNRYST
jgi:hypothetical protein